MKKEDIYTLFQIEDLRDLPEAVYGVIFGDKDRRDEVYVRLLELNKFDMSHDWFSAMYEEELAERSQKKQDFTPTHVAKLVAKLAGDGATVHEPTAGNGALLISTWYERIKADFDFKPSDFMVNCWELSTRSIPILLLNLSIRGMMGYVYHGDVLTQKVKQKYILLNRANVWGFSEVIKANINDKIIKRD